jgi:short-subunit dehydrogenase
VTLIPQNEHFLITGASSGLGAALARCWASRGNALTLLGRDRIRLEAVATDCRQFGGDVVSACCDVRNAAEMQEALLAADDRRPVNAVVANAGIGGSAVLAGPEGEAIDLAHEVFNTNMIGVLNTIEPLKARFVQRRSGRFVIVSSMAALEGFAEAPVYGASKAASRLYGLGLRRLLAQHQIQVNVVTPGFVATPMSASLPFKPFFQWSDDRAAEYILRGLIRNKAEIAFPWQLHLGISMTRVLPTKVVDYVLAKASARLGTAS